jgi:hypothetical protein
VSEKLCVQFASKTVGPVNVEEHPVEDGAWFDQTNAPAELSMLTSGQA